MARATNATASRKSRKKRLNLARGFIGGRSRLFRTATEAVDRARVQATTHRKTRKRDYRSLWIIRLGAACKLNDMTYCRFMEGIKKAGIGLNRKMLSEIAIHDPDGFRSLVETARKASA